MRERRGRIRDVEYVLKRGGTVEFKQLDVAGSMYTAHYSSGRDQVITREEMEARIKRIKEEWEDD